MSEKVSIADRAQWLCDPALQALLGALSQEGELARVAGGAVRNALLGEPVTDIDIATTTTPDETEARASGIGMRTAPTGKDHGTITVIDPAGRAYEVTTLRDDVETDGRRAKVSFGRDWQRDAERRDFTINALYAAADGTVIDLVGGLADLERRNLRFIGEADQRIREDYLRILRFFRFFAIYGSGRPDAAGLKACARLKEGLASLSAERVWSELRKLLGAADPSRALLWMRQTGVLTAVIPESEKWGIDAIPALVDAERALGWAPDPLARLQAIVPPDPGRMEAMGRRLRMSRAEADRLTRWAMAETPRSDASERVLLSQLYFADRVAVLDRLRLALAIARRKASEDPTFLPDAGRLVRLVELVENWKAPVFPLKGGDLVELGLEKGRKVGELLSRLELEWVDGSFAASREALLVRAAAILKDEAAPSR
jgi:poly(A) polymerase